MSRRGLGVPFSPPPRRDAGKRAGQPEAEVSADARPGSCDADLIETLAAAARAAEQAQRALDAIQRAVERGTPPDRASIAAARARIAAAHAALGAVEPALGRLTEA